MKRFAYCDVCLKFNASTHLKSTFDSMSNLRGSGREGGNKKEKRHLGVTFIENIYVACLLVLSQSGLVAACSCALSR